MHCDVLQSAGLSWAGLCGVVFLSAVLSNDILPARAILCLILLFCPVLVSSFVPQLPTHTFLFCSMKVLSFAVVSCSYAYPCRSSAVQHTSFAGE